ncbi:MAG: alpha/beta fold hydrolase [Oscillospiraceae bacterium]
MENFIEVDGGKLWTCMNGKTDGRAILLCNGGPGCCDYLAPVSEMLEREYCVIRFEQRGCGRSVCDGKYDLETTVQDMEGIREFYHLSSWIVGGHSWGANLALVYALKNPEHVDSILYIAGNGIHNDRHWSEEYHNNKDKYGEITCDMDYSFNNDVNILGNATLRAFGRTPDFYKRLSVLAINTLFVMAEHDIRPSWAVEQLYHIMPRAEYVVIPNAAHYIWLFNSEELKAALLTFIKNDTES